LGAGSGVGAGVNFALGGVGSGLWMVGAGVGCGVGVGVSSKDSPFCYSFFFGILPSRTCAPTAIMSKITANWPFAARPEFVKTKISVATYPAPAMKVRITAHMLNKVWIEVPQEVEAGSPSDASQHVR